ncbi:3-methyladenine DNA glycosylase, partial [Arthrobacter crystallopoietes BAB-32]
MGGRTRRRSLIEWRTLDSNGGTLLQFRSRAENRDFLTEGSAGWDTLLDALEDVAAGRIPQPQPQRWDELREAYSREYSLSHTMGTLGKDSGRPCIHFDRLLKTDREAVWQALTEPAQFEHWLAPGSLDLQAGGTIRLDFETFTMEGDVSYVLHGQGLDYGWRSPEVQESSVHWLLEGTNGKTLLKTAAQPAFGRPRTGTAGFLAPPAGCPGRTALRRRGPPVRAPARCAPALLPAADRQQPALVDAALLHWLARPAVDVAPGLLGATLAKTTAEGRVGVRITEVEAYLGESDPGSHAFRGQTNRNKAMFGPAGHIYVYFTYGMHHCVNIVCGHPGQATGVLIRAGEVVDGVAVAQARRPSAR